MSAFVNATLVGIEVDAEDGERVISRFLSLQAADFRFEVFDTHPEQRQLAVGQTYEWLLQLAFPQGLVLRSGPPGRPSRADPRHSATQARILDAHWWLPSAWSAAVLPADQRQSAVLLETPIGRMITSRRMLQEELEVRPSQDDTLVWERARIDLVGVAGITLTPTNSARRSRRARQAESADPTPEIRTPPLEVQERLDKHVNWLDSQGQEGRQFGMRQGLDGLAMNERKLDLRGLLLAGARLDEASLAQVRLDGADLSGANLTHAFLGGGSLVEATLDSANLTRVRSPHADLQRAIVRQVVANRADFSYTNMQEADLTNAHLREADFEDSDLTNAALEGADLTDANLENAQLAGARLTGARLMGAFLEGATGIELVMAKFAFVGASDAPQRLEGDALLQWLQAAVVKTVRVPYDAPEN